jgi:hypothetical protein
MRVFSKGKHYLRFILSSSFLELYAKVFLPAAPQGLVVRWNDSPENDNNNCFIEDP